ncbi:MAG: hypothetical protein EP338_06350 [Bacteroidetes bacterium]|nr:MAG: hypothetical protein EP338_06350 [Bacteroidota bacterium]
MSRSQETFNKKQREKKRAQRKKEKLEKKELRRGDSTAAIEIDWSSAPENKTLSDAEEAQKTRNKQQSK